MKNQIDRNSLLCVIALFAATLVLHAPALTGKVLLPADVVQLMRPWGAHSRERFPDFRFVHNPMHGPIFEYTSWRHQSRERMRIGEVPLWNPYELSGTPLLANSQSAVLYPPNLLLYVFPLWVGINLVTLLHTFLTGLFLFLLLRRVGLCHPASLTGALIWMLCGTLIAWTEYQTPTAVLAWLPAALWGWQRGADRNRSMESAVLSGCALAMALLAGHLHFAFYVLVAFGIWAVWPGSGRIWVRATTAASAVGLALLLAACTLLPTVELARQNFRGTTTSYEASISLRLPPENLFTLALPNLLGNPVHYVDSIDKGGSPGHPYRGKFEFSEYALYLGVPGLALALAGLTGVFALRKQRFPHSDAGENAHIPWWADRQVCFAAILLVGMLLALGTPLCAVFFYGMPGYKQFNATARAVCLFSFGAAGLAAYGLHRCLSGTDDMKRAAIKCLGWCIGFALLLGLAAFPGMSPYWLVTNDQGKQVSWMLTDDWFDYEVAGLTGLVVVTMILGTAIWLLKNLEIGPKRRFPSLLVWVFPLIAATDLLRWGMGFNTAVDPAMLGGESVTASHLRQTKLSRVHSIEDPAQGLKSMIAPNYNAVVGYREIQGADSLHTLRYHRFAERLVKALDPTRTNAFADANTIRIPGGTHPVLDILNVRTATTGNGKPPGPDWQPEASAPPTAELSHWANPNVMGAAWLPFAVENVRDLEEGLNRTFDPNSDPKQTAYIEGALSQSRVNEPGHATVSEVSPHHRKVIVEAERETYLCVSEPIYPGWRATIGGQPLPILPLYSALMAIPVPQGNSEVELTYDPSSWRAGLFLSLVAMGAVAAFGAYSLAAKQPK